MSYQPIYYDEGRYTIEDPEYGDSLCRIEFFPDTRSELSEDEMEELCRRFMRLIRDKLAERRDEREVA
jgi:hypothetical protein